MQPRTAVIRVYDDASNVIDTHEHAGDSKNRKRSLEGPWVRRRARVWSWQKLEREEVGKTMLPRHDSKDSHHEQSVTDRVVLTVL